MFLKAYCCLIKEAMIEYHLLPIEFQNYTLSNIIKLVIQSEISCQSENDQLDLKTEKGPYPWLDLEDSRRYMSDEQILEEYVESV